MQLKRKKFSITLKKTGKSLNQTTTQLLFMFTVLKVCFISFASFSTQEIITN